MILAFTLLSASSLAVAQIPAPSHNEVGNVQDNTDSNVSIGSIGDQYNIHITNFNYITAAEPGTVDLVINCMKWPLPIKVQPNSSVRVIRTNPALFSQDRPYVDLINATDHEKSFPTSRLPILSWLSADFDETEYVRCEISNHGKVNVTNAYLSFRYHTEREVFSRSKDVTEDDYPRGMSIGPIDAGKSVLVNVANDCPEEIFFEFLDPVLVTVAGRKGLLRAPLIDASADREASFGLREFHRKWLGYDSCRW